MSKEILAFEDTEVKNNTFYRHKTHSCLKDVDVEKVLVSKKISFGEKTINILLVTCIISIKLNYI